MESIHCKHTELAVLFIVTELVVFILSTYGRIRILLTHSNTGNFCGFINILVSFIYSCKHFKQTLVDLYTKAASIITNFVNFVLTTGRIGRKLNFMRG